MPDAPSVSSTAEQLVSALTEGGFRYALIGGVAVILNGYDRSTQDVDAVVWDLDARLDELADLLGRHGFSFRIPNGKSDARRIRVLRLVNSNGVNADLSMGLLPFEEEVISRADAMLVADGVRANVATVEDLVIMKLVASRERDLDDVTRLLELHPKQNNSRIKRIVEDFANVLEDPNIVQNLRQRVK